MTTSLYRSFVGLEFRDDAIAVSCLKNDFSGIHLLSSRIFPLKDDDASIAEMNSFISRYVNFPAQAFVSVPYKWSMVRFVEVPSPKGKGKDALMQMMQFEIERHIPYQIEDIYYDVQVMEEKEDTYKVLFAAVQKEKIDYVKGYFERLSLNPQIITLSPFALLNSLEYSGVLVGGWQGALGITKKPDVLGQKGVTSLVLLIYKKEVFFSVLRDGAYVHLKSFSVNPDNLTNGIIEGITTELSALHIENPRETINKVILLGTEVQLSDISMAIEERIGLRVQTVDPLSRVLKDKTEEAGYDVLASIGGCYAGFETGTLGINLLPHKTDIVTRKTGTMIARVAASLILIFIIGIFAGELINDKRLLTKVQAKIKENEPDIKIIEKISADMKLLKQKKDFILDRKEKDILLNMLTELANIMPADSWITDFDYKETLDTKSGVLRGELIISGQASSSSPLISILENSPYLEKVEFVGSVTTSGNKEGFKIKAVTGIPVKSPEVTGPQDQKEKAGKEAKGSK